MVLGTLAGISWTYWLAFAHPGSSLNVFPYNALLFWVWYPSYHLGLLLGQRPVAGRDTLAPRNTALLVGLAVARHRS